MPRPSQDSSQAPPAQMPSTMQMTPYLPWGSQPGQFAPIIPPLQLRLTIQRPHHPDLKLWHDVPRSPPTTIAQLLAALNADIPLETDDLGLEDYVVFGGEYELLHFKIVANIMREDVLYVVRPLSLDERKARRDGGRERVDAGGARLYDGVAFGRTKRRRVGRVTKTIEPTGVQEQETEATGAKLKGVLRTNGVARERRRSVSFVEEGQSQAELAETDEAGTSDEEDSDYDADELEESLNDDEMADLVQDADVDDSELHSTTSRLRSGKQLLLKDSSGETKTTEATKTKRKQVSSDSDSSDSSSDSDSSDSSDSGPETISSKRRKLNTTQANGLSAKVSTQKVTSSNAAHQRPPKLPSPSDSESVSSSSVSSSSSDSTSSSDSSTAQSFNKNVQPKQPAKQLAKPQVNGTSKSKIANTSAPLAKSGPAAKQKQSAPGQGREGTKARNQRKKYQRALKARQAKGLEPMEMTAQEYKAKCMAEEAEAAAKPAENAAGPTALEQRRQLLLDRIAEGGIDVTMELDVQMAKPADEVQLATELVNDAEQSGALPLPQADSEMTDLQPELPPRLDGAAHSTPLSNTPASESQSASASATPNQVEDQASQRRSKTLDVASTRRLLFGSLGVRAPKTKVDEERIRNRLASLGNRAPVTAPTTGKAATGAVSTTKKLIPSAENTNLDAWKTKIKLTAVECVNEDVGLSEPPFPFVQRWDVSQQLPRGKKRKRKSHVAAAYDDEIEVDDSQMQYDDSNIQLDYDEKPTEATAVLQPSTITTHLSADTNAMDAQHMDDGAAEDLPELPTAVSTLPALQAADFRVGDVIAFRQLSEPSAATNWQPVVSEYMTAVFIAGPAKDQLRDRDIIGLRLAWRDREQNEFMYDDNGERIYSKFDMQVDDDNDEYDDKLDGGVLYVTLSELINYEAKLLVAAPLDDCKKYWNLVAPPGCDLVKDHEAYEAAVSSESPDQAEQDSTTSSMLPRMDALPADTTSQNFVASTQDSEAKSDVEWEDEDEQDDDQHEVVDSTVLVRDSQIAQPDIRKINRYRVRQDAEYEKVASQLSLAAILAQQKGE